MHKYIHKCKHTCIHTYVNYTCFYAFAVCVVSVSECVCVELLSLKNKKNEHLEILFDFGSRY